MKTAITIGSKQVQRLYYIELQGNLPLGEILGIDVLVQGAHISAVYKEVFPHIGIQEGFKYLEGRIEEPVLVNNMQGSRTKWHRSLQKQNSSLIQILPKLYLYKPQAVRSFSALHLD